MKRRLLIIAAVVTVAALACVVPMWWEIWLAVAYEEQVPDPTKYSKRFSFLPGPTEYYRPEVCAACNAGRCSVCIEERSAQLDIWADCTCPTCHPESER